jgi:uncharacterized protein YbjQ (UPF0145 family)
MKKPIFAIIISAAFVLMACRTTDYTSNMSGASDYATVAVKDFVTLGIITVHSTETHYSSAFGVEKRVEGSKITYSDLLQEAAKLEADDIINVRIDVNATYKESIFKWFTGWKRVYTHTGTALAIKYTNKLDSKDPDPQLNGIPKAPESTGAVRTTRTGRVVLP